MVAPIGFVNPDNALELRPGHQAALLEVRSHMPPTTFARAVAAVVSLTCIGCSGESPVQPSPSGDAAAAAGVMAAQAAPGVYDLSFRVWSGGILQPVASLNVSSDELILMAHVTDGAGAPVSGGNVTFEYCSYKRLPPNDITRADEAPKEACEQGTASWGRLRSITLNASCEGFGAGYTCTTFGVVKIPRTVGFRFRFSGQRSGIASGSSVPLNFTWTSAGA